MRLGLIAVQRGEADQREVKYSTTSRFLTLFQLRVSTIRRVRRTCRSCEGHGASGFVSEGEEAFGPGPSPGRGGPCDDRRSRAVAIRGQGAARAVSGYLPPDSPTLRACRPLLSLWGRSRNVDEYARQPIVHSAILRAIGQIADVPLRRQIVHAGLEHTYGYLFSLIETPFGRKRDRWTRASIEDGFGIRYPDPCAEPVEGTLLTNLTWFAGHIAFRDRPRELRRLQQMSAYVSPVARQYPYASLDLSRVCEDVTIPSAGGIRRPLQLRTDLVPFPCQPTESATDNHLLVYSVHNEGAGWCD